MALLRALTTLRVGLVTSEKMPHYVRQKAQAKSKLGTNKASLGVFEPYTYKFVSHLPLEVELYSQVSLPLLVKWSSHFMLMLIPSSMSRMHSENPKHSMYPNNIYIGPKVPI